MVRSIEQCGHHVPCALIGTSRKLAAYNIRASSPFLFPPFILPPPSLPILPSTLSTLSTPAPSPPFPSPSLSYQLNADSVQNVLAVQRLNLAAYLNLFVPAVEWILQCIAHQAPEVDGCGVCGCGCGVWMGVVCVDGCGCGVCGRDVCVCGCEGGW